MYSSDIPTKFTIPFGNAAGSEFIQKPIPTDSQIGVEDGRASLTDGFVPLNFEPVAAGGIPPWGRDMNGILYEITQWLRFAAAGGLPPTYDAAFAEAVSGYPKGALLQSTTTGHYWVSTSENNATDPDAAGAGWTMFPDVLIQKQAGNWASSDTGTQNHPAITLYPAPASLAAIVGSPIRFKIGYPNTITTPNVNINQLGAVTMINSDGTAIVVGQFARAKQIIEGFLDGEGYFQVTSPAKPFPAGPELSPFFPGCIYICPVETPFVGTLECDGSLKNIVDYPRLYNVIGKKYGGDGITNFRVPDLRGEFIRGWDHGRGKDPNAGARTNRGDGTVGDHVGTKQAQNVGAFTATGEIRIKWPLFWYGHDWLWPDEDVFGNPTGASPYIGLADSNGGNITTPLGTGQAGNIVGGISGECSWPVNQGQETRPTNVYMMYVIAY